MQSATGAAQRQGQQLPRCGVGAQHLAVVVQRDQAIAFAAQCAAGPVQPHQPVVRARQQQRVFDRAGRSRHQVPQLGPLGHIHARQVQHAHAAPFGVEQGSACAAVGTVVIAKVFAPVQPHGGQLGQRRADGGGAHSGFRQVHPHPPDQLAARVVPVHRALHVDHHAACVGQHREVAHARNRAGELIQHRPRGLHQRMAFIGQLAQCLAADGVEDHLVPGVEPGGQAPLPRARDPWLQRRLATRAQQNALPGPLDQGLAVVGCRIGSSKHRSPWGRALGVPTTGVHTRLGGNG